MLFFQYDFEILDFKAAYSTVRILNDLTDRLYPTHELEYLSANSMISDLLVILVMERGKVIGYVPAYKVKTLTFIKELTVMLPIVVKSNNYLELFRTLQQFLRSKFRMIRYVFNFLDEHKDEITRFLGQKRCVKDPFRTSVAFENWLPNKSIRRELRRAEANDLVISNEITSRSVKDFYSNCIKTVRERKGLRTVTDEESRNMYSFYRNLERSGHGRLILVRSKDDGVVSGTFLIYNDKVCIYYHAGTSNIGRNLSAGYLSIFQAIKFARSLGTVFDTYGSYIGRDSNYDKLYLFKKQWGSEIDISQYVDGGAIHRFAYGHMTKRFS